MTRHNMGAIVVHSFCKKKNLTLKEEKRFSAIAGRALIEDADIHALFPMTYMNESGRSVRSYLTYYRLEPEDLLVVVDDADLPFGSMRMREKGSAGGHNGLKSIEAELQTQDYARLRIGIGRDKRQEDLADYVLSTFSAEELKCLPEICLKAEKSLERLIEKSLAAVISEVNKREKHETKEPTI